MEYITWQEANQNNQQAFFYLKKNDISHAQSLFQKNVDFYPTYQTLNNYGVFCYENLRQTYKIPGISFLKQAIKHEPNHKSFAQLAYIYAIQQRFHASQKMYTSALQMQETPERYNNLGTVLCQLKQFQPADYCFSKSMHLYEEDFDKQQIPLFSLIVVKARCGKEDEANQLFDFALENLRGAIQWVPPVVPYCCKRYAFLCGEYYKQYLNFWSVSEKDLLYFVRSFRIVAIDELEKFYALLEETQDINQNKKKPFQAAERFALSAKHLPVYDPNQLMKEDCYYDEVGVIANEMKKMWRAGGVKHEKKL